MHKIFIMPSKLPLNKLLIDSNSYFRLAQSLHPLLNCQFGNDNHCIYILKECDQEYSKNTGLQNKFSWMNHEEYVKNRKIKLTYDITAQNGVEHNMRFIKTFAQENYLNVSEVDRKYLAVALELDTTLITDDSDMIAVAIEFEIPVMRTLELLKLMLDCNHIDVDKVKEITGYWIYSNDTPKDFKKDCKALFDIEY